MNRWGGLTYAAIVMVLGIGPMAVLLVVSLQVLAVVWFAVAMFALVAGGRSLLSRLQRAGCGQRTGTADPGSVWLLRGVTARNPREEKPWVLDVDDRALTTSEED